MDHGLVLVSGGARGDVDLAIHAEKGGFDSVFSIEFFNRHGFVALGAIAQATSRVRIGTAIANSFTRTPLLHASAAMDLDELSAGRMILGLGSATRRMNQDWYGVPFSAPASRMTELVTLLRAVFAAKDGGGFRFEGKYWDLKVPLYVRANAAREQIPIWIAAVNKRMIRAAGNVADGLVGHPIATRRWHRDVTLSGIVAGEEETGRAAGACLLKPYLLTVIADTREQALREAKGQIGFYYTTKLYHSILEHHGWGHIGLACNAALKTFDLAALSEAITDELVDEIAIACAPDEAKDRLKQWDGLTDEVLFYPPTVGLAPERVVENAKAIVDVFGASCSVAKSNGNA
jgi:probable F420-dependent oxidoreductase